MSHNPHMNLEGGNYGSHTPVASRHMWEIRVGQQFFFHAIKIEVVSTL